MDKGELGGMLGRIFHSPRAAAIATWLSIFAAISGSLGFIAKLTPEWFGKLTWPQTILAGIGLTTALLLALSIIALIGAYAYRHFKSLPAASAPIHDIDNHQELIRTFWSRVGGTSTSVGHHIIAGLAIAPNTKLTNVKVFLAHAEMMGWGHPPHWGGLSDRRQLLSEQLIQAGEEKRITLLERDWDDLKNPVEVAGHVFGEPSELDWPFKLLKVDLVSDQLSISRDFALFMPGYSVVMIVDATSVEMSGNTFAGPLSMNDPRIRSDG